VTLLTPHDGATLNADHLRVQALVAAVTSSDRFEGFLFDKYRRAGRNVGTIDGVDVFLDQALVARVAAAPCRREFLLDESVDLTTLADGPHTIRVVAYDERGRRRIGTTATLAFALDRSLALAVPDRIEAHATPAPFACFNVRDNDDDEDDRGPRPIHPEVHGRFALGGGSDGVDFAQDRVVIVADGRAVAIEPGAFRCDRHGEVCRYEKRGDPFLRRVFFERHDRREWHFQITGGPAWPADPVFYLRVGNDWGGRDLAAGERLVRLRPALDPAHAGHAVIDASGGTVEAHTVDGVVIRLIVPPGALTQATSITATPLAAPPLAGEPAGGVGVEFEPDGLVFARPATLEMDFTGAAHPPAPGAFLYLVTSPMTRIPLADVGGSGAVLTASVAHFSMVDGGATAPLFGNLTDWDPRLEGTGALTFSELARMADLLRVQLAEGCTTAEECAAIDAALADIVGQTDAAITALLPSCSGDVAAPTRAAFDHWKTVLALAQGLDVPQAGILDCLRGVLDSLVTKTGRDGLATPTDAAVDALNDLEGQAQGLAFATVAAHAHTYKHDVLSAVIDAAGGAATADPSLANLQRMRELQGRAQTFAFSDLARRVLEKSVGAARTAISRLQSACAANATAPTTDVAKELARTWAAFINQDPTVAPTLAADVQAAINNCGGTLATVFGGDPGWLRTAIYGASSGIGGFFTELQAPANLPFHMRYTDYGGVQDMRLSASGNIVGMDLDIDAHPTVVFDAGPSLDSTIASATLDFTFPRNGTLTMEINHSWLTEYATDVPQWGASALIKRPTEPVSIGGTVLMANCLAESCTNLRPIPAPDAPSSVTIPVTAGSMKLQMVVQVYASSGTTAHGRIITLTYTPAP